MNYTYLITPEMLQQFEDVSMNIKPERIKTYIKKAQELDLKLFLGHALYYELLSYFNEDGSISIEAPQAYQNLFNGCNYTDRFGHNIRYEGIATTLIYFTFARFIEADAIHYTAFGPVIKRQENAEALKPADITKLVQQQRSVANAHAREVEKYLLDNKQSFPLWQYNAKNASSRQAGPRIRAVDKTDFNSPGNLGPAADYLSITEFIN